MDGSIEGLPNFSDQIIDGIPTQRTVCDASEPAHQVCGRDISMSVQVVRDGYFVVFERRRDESDAELSIWTMQRGGCGCVASRGYVRCGNGGSWG